MCDLIGHSYLSVDSEGISAQFVKFQYSLVAHMFDRLLVPRTYDWNLSVFDWVGLTDMRF